MNTENTGIFSHLTLGNDKTRSDQTAESHLQHFPQIPCQEMLIEKKSPPDIITQVSPDTGHTLQRNTLLLILFQRLTSEVRISIGNNAAGKLCK